MTPDEIVDLLTMAAAFDQRTVGEGDAMAWHAVLGDLAFADAKQAVLGYYADSRERIMPADVRKRVKAIRRDRIEREIIAAPPAELTDESGRYKEALRAQIKEIADGRSIQRAIGQLPSETPPPVAEVRKALGPALPPAERHLTPEEIARRQVTESRVQRGAPRDVPEPDAPEEDPAA